MSTKFNFAIIFPSKQKERKRKINKKISREINKELVKNVALKIRTKKAKSYIEYLVRIKLKRISFNYCDTIKRLQYPMKNCIFSINKNLFCISIIFLLLVG